MTTGWSPWAQHHKHHGHKSNRIFLYTKWAQNTKRTRNEKKMKSSQSNYQEPCVIWCVSHFSFDVWPFQYDALAICATWPNRRAAVEAQNFSIRKNHTIIIIDRFDRFIVISLRSLFCFFTMCTHSSSSSRHIQILLQSIESRNSFDVVSDGLTIIVHFFSSFGHSYAIVQLVFFSLFTNSKPLNIIIDKCAASNHFQWRRKKSEQFVREKNIHFWLTHWHLKWSNLNSICKLILRQNHKLLTK